MNNTNMLTEQEHTHLHLVWLKDEHTLHTGGNDIDLKKTHISFHKSRFEIIS